jgi:hypothetical protein
LIVARRKALGAVHVEVLQIVPNRELARVCPTSSAKTLLKLQEVDFPNRPDVTQNWNREAYFQSESNATQSGFTPLVFGINGLS